VSRNVVPPPRRGPLPGLAGVLREPLDGRFRAFGGAVIGGIRTLF
jgi:hypothetical protein